MPVIESVTTFSAAVSVLDTVTSLVPFIEPEAKDVSPTFRSTVPAVTEIVAVLSEASVFSDTVTSTLLPIHVPTTKASLSDVAFQPSTLVLTIIVTVSPAAATLVLLAFALRYGVLFVTVNMNEAFAQRYSDDAAAIAVMVVVPAFKGVISPVSDTVATVASLDV